MGDGVWYDPDFIRFGDNMEICCSPEDNNVTSVDYRLNMASIVSGDVLEKPIFLINNSDMEMFYRWEKQSAICSTSDPKNSWSHLPTENLTIQPVMGSLNANSITFFKVVVQMNDVEPGEYCTTLR
ncbi:uncharacterized protein LOC124304569 [Neodiprion virginianus]|uniref:Uncharacterized protein LOC124294746 n=1 Tax=Neodiprion lecontei TaxID=441921 RepID=A0ABM3GBF6_NEOLC|nr:uncharacterized protein LOC124182274 [Neodiprion fabricii]XP_046482767.1 uncharacterized protein LOC124219362 [Neodiprion pinetum]XP_046597605.1 uncharacterized protein LOC124294746 [Neodiprion lecontei]XP_046618922.1 uncharacterized protein LOC124304569 [Neodiprion virginianus]